MTENWFPRTVDVAGHHIAALLRGTDRRLPPVILIHGIAASIDLWPAVLQTSFEQFRCCSLSLPGHTPSIAPASFGETDVTCDLFADIVIAAAKEIFPDDAVHLAGWSTGGFAVLAAAAKQPMAFASVSSISGFARGRWGDLLGVLQWLSSSKWGRSMCRWNLTQLARNPWLMDRILDRFCKGSANRLKDPALDHDASQTAWNSLLDATGNHDSGVLTTVMQGIRNLDLTDQLCRITAPTQIISGDADSVIRHTEAIHLANSIAPSKLVVIPDCGHMFFAEARERVLELAVAWIDQHERKGHEQTEIAGEE